MGSALDWVTKPELPHFFFDLVGRIEVTLLYGAAELVARIGRLELEKAEPTSSVVEGDAELEPTPEPASSVVEGDVELEPTPEPASSVVDGASEEPAVWDRCEQDRS